MRLSTITQLRNILEAEWRPPEHLSPPELTPLDRTFLSLMRKRTSDKKVRLALNKTQDELLTLSFALRKKLGLPPGASLRDAAKDLGIK